MLSNTVFLFCCFLGFFFDEMGQNLDELQLEHRGEKNLNIKHVQGCIFFVPFYSGLIDLLVFSHTSTQKGASSVVCTFSLE